jgi:dephospho-CoA kinase
MIKLAVVGGIGSGKSVVSRMLGIMGVPVYD